MNKFKFNSSKLHKRHAEALQEALFRMGYQWGSDSSTGKHTPQRLDCFIYLSSEEKKRLSYSEPEDEKFYDCRWDYAPLDMGKLREIFITLEREARL